MANLATAASRGESNYRLEIRAATRGLWKGIGDYDWFYREMDTIIRRGIPQAFYDGAKECGILPAELTPEEMQVIDGAVYEELGYIGGFAKAIGRGSPIWYFQAPHFLPEPENGGKLGPLMDRADMWVQRYNNIRERGKSMACADRKAEWIYGDTIEHCASCSKVAGRVYRISVWDRYGWVPGSRALACGGWRCDCKRQFTDAPVTPGRPPSL